MPPAGFGYCIHDMHGLDRCVFDVHRIAAAHPVKPALSVSPVDELLEHAKTIIELNQHLIACLARFSRLNEQDFSISEAWGQVIA